VSAKDYVFSAVFIGLIFLQVRGRRVTVRSLLLPVIIVGVAADRYLRAIPAGGNNLALVAVCSGIGLCLGVIGALVTSVRPGPDGRPVARAGLLAVLVWIVGTGSRLALGIYVSNGGAAAVASMARSHHIDARTALPTALILMALGEVLGRYGLLGLRAWSMLSGHGGTPGSGTGRTRGSARSSMMKR
jgi:hypothetical protein